MKELVILSGKGGTGKTSIAASFAALAGLAVVADCDVDAADLHLVLNPAVQRREPFHGGKQARILHPRCTGCGRCLDVCRFEAIRCTAGSLRVDPLACEGCGVCSRICPMSAIAFEPACNGEWFVSETRYGPMVHAQLGVGGENSGKLVSLIRREAKQVAMQRALDLIIADGSPGIGCPVIASLAAADLVLMVTEPTLAGLHDLERLADLIRHFPVPGMICVNRWDINPEVTVRIEAMAAARGLALAGRIRHQSAVTAAQMIRQTVVEYDPEGAGAEIRAVWSAVQRHPVFAAEPFAPGKQGAAC